MCGERGSGNHSDCKDALRGRTAGTRVTGGHGWGIEPDANAPRVIKPPRAVAVKKRPRARSRRDPEPETPRGMMLRRPGIIYVLSGAAVIAYVLASLSGGTEPDLGPMPVWVGGPLLVIGGIILSFTERERKKGPAPAFLRPTMNVLWFGVVLTLVAFALVAPVSYTGIGSLKYLSVFLVLSTNILLLGALFVTVSVAFAGRKWMRGWRHPPDNGRTWAGRIRGAGYLVVGTGGAFHAYFLGIRLTELHENATGGLIAMAICFVCGTVLVILSEFVEPDGRGRLWLGQIVK